MLEILNMFDPVLPPSPYRDDIVNFEIDCSECFKRGGAAHFCKPIFRVSGCRKDDHHRHHYRRYLCHHHYHCYLHGHYHHHQ